MLGIDIGGIGTKVSLLDSDGTLLGHDHAPTPQGGAAMADVAAQLGMELARVHQRTLIAAGAGVAGVVEDGVIVAASSSFSGWTGFPVLSAFEERLQVPVVVDNDVNAFLVGEVRLGALRGTRNALGIALGTGVGGALWLNGSLYNGPRGAAGEIGHMPGFGAEPCTCGQTGHLETLASGRGIARRYQERVGEPLTGGAKEVAARARAGDALAASVFKDAGIGVGRAALIVAAILDVVDVVIGGGVAGAADLLRPGIDEFVAAEPPVSGRPLEVRFAELGPAAASVGAATMAEPVVRLPV